MRKFKALIPILIITLLILPFAGCSGGDNKTEGTGEKEGPTFDLRLSTMTSNEHTLTKSAQRYADAVFKATDGDVKITIYPSNQLGDSASVYDELMMGSIDLAWQTVPDKYDVKANAGMTPYIVSDWDDVKKLYADKDLWLFKTMSEVNGNQGVTLLGLLPNGFMGIGAQSLGDLNTLFDPNVKQNALIRSASIDSLIAQVEAFGFNVTTIPYADLYSALQTGIADGWYGGSLISNNVGFKDVIKYFVEYKAVNEAMGMLISTKTMESLPEEYQEILVKLAEEENIIGMDEVQKAEEEARTALQEYGITIITPTDEELQAVAKSVRDKVYPIFAGDFGEELMNEINSWVSTLD